MKLSHLISALVASVIMWGGIGGMVALGSAIGKASEGDRFGNCHIYGDGKCGESAPWHGFTGSTPEEPLIKCVNGFRVETITAVDNITCL